MSPVQAQPLAWGLALWAGVWGTYWDPKLYCGLFYIRGKLVTKRKDWTLGQAKRSLEKHCASENASWDRTTSWENVSFDEFQLLKNTGWKRFENCLTFSKWQSFSVFRSKCCFILIVGINWRLKNVGTEMKFLKMDRKKMFSSSFRSPVFLFLRKLRRIYIYLT